MVMDESCETPDGRETFDLAVIGAGSAGFSAAISAAELGARVTLLGHGTIGGTCVNVGCVPSKTLIRATDALHQARAATRFAGLGGGAEVASWAALIAQKDALVATLRQEKYIDLLPAYNRIAYLEGAARLADGGVAHDGTLIPVPRVVIATGAGIEVPPIAGLDRVPYLTSETAMALKTLPRSMIVIGGGPIGCELGQMFARAGVKVTLMCRSRLLPEGEPEISAALADCLRDEGIDVHTGVSYGVVAGNGHDIAVSFTGDGAPETVGAGALLVAAGRRPNTDGLGLIEAGVSMTAGGGIAVDDEMRTTAPGIFAAGDVTGRDMYVYMAAYGGKIAAENALGGDARRYDNSAMPGVTFTDPQVAHVGLTEEAARDAGIVPKTSVFRLSSLPRAIAARDTRGLIKLVADQANDRLLGAHLLAPEAGEAVQTAAMALKAGMTARDLAGTVFPYLTTVEGLKLAAQGFEKDIALLSCCAG
jgi:mercuric reductase